MSQVNIYTYFNVTIEAIASGHSGPDTDALLP